MMYWLGTLWGVFGTIAMIYVGFIKPFSDRKDAKKQYKYNKQRKLK